jgi:hypothetical protein
MEREGRANIMETTRNHQRVGFDDNFPIEFCSLGLLAWTVLQRKETRYG